MIFLNVLTTTSQYRLKMLLCPHCFTTLWLARTVFSHTIVLKLTPQHWKSPESGNFPNRDELHHWRWRRDHRWCWRAFTFLSNFNPFFHKFPRSIDRSFSLSDYRKLILSTIHVSDTKNKMINIAPFHRFSRSIDHDWHWRRTDTYTFRTAVIGAISVYFCE